jgi:hypothetical protein
MIVTLLGYREEKMTHAHITTWVLVLILFFVALFLYNGRKLKGAKIVHMVLRLFYILVLLTGGMLIEMTGMYLLKAIAGLWVLSSIEMVLVKTAKGKSTKGFWIQFVISLILVLYLGYTLPK